MIEQATVRADRGAAIAQRVGVSLDEIADATMKVNSILGDIATASGEQSKGIGLVNGSISDLDRLTQASAGNSEELASGAEETASQATALQGLVARFRLAS